MAPPPASSPALDALAILDHFKRSVVGGGEVVVVEVQRNAVFIGAGYRNGKCECRSSVRHATGRSSAPFRLFDRLTVRRSGTIDYRWVFRPSKATIDIVVARRDAGASGPRSSVD